MERKNAFRDSRAIEVTGLKQTKNMTANVSLTSAHTSDNLILSNNGLSSQLRFPVSFWCS